MSDSFAATLRAGLVQNKPYEYLFKACDMSNTRIAMMASRQDRTSVVMQLD